MRISDWSSDVCSSDLDCRSGIFQPLLGFIQVNDMDPVLLHENIGSHLGIPFAGKVPKMHTGIQQFVICCSCHVVILLVLAFTELESSASFAATVFLTFHHAGITGE